MPPESPPSDEGPADARAQALAQARIEERAPLLGSWRRWYLVVLTTMAALVALFEYLSVHYR